VFRGKAIDVQQKKKRREHEVDYRVRNYENGWVFARAGVTPPAGVVEQALAAVSALGLDFGAVDIGYNEKFNRAVVYEVNTAPGVEGTTLLNYGAKLKEYMGVLKSNGGQKSHMGSSNF
jgi:D-alanine-D-alanine ligase-like ATP-grasp enzyme